LTIFPLPEPVYLEGDADRLTQVFANLLTNACKFTEPGGRIRVRLEPQGSDVVVRIADTGIGIAPQFLATIFERFVQVGDPSERGGGLGIGLGLAKQLVELHGGSITASSRGLGQGSEFVVRLPILLDLDETLNSGPEPKPSSTTPTLRILVVDDSPDTVESLSLLLGVAGHQTATASNGLAAITLAETYRPEVILLDIGLPGMSGYDVCRAIRAMPWGQAVMVIAITGWGHEEERRRTAEAGFTAHLVKPVIWSQLALLLSKAERVSD
jgi:CheY-like chemotaxis protein